MPSIFNTNMPGLSKVKSDQPVKASSVAKAGGTAEGYTSTSVSRPSPFSGSSNDGINAAYVVASDELNFAVGSTVGAVDEIRKVIEITPSNQNRQYSDAYHEVLQGREQNTTGLTRLRTGTWIDESGNPVTTPTGIVTDYEIINGSGDRVTLDRSTPQNYTYKLGNTIVDQNLDLRNG